MIHRSEDSETLLNMGGAMIHRGEGFRNASQNVRGDDSEMHDSTWEGR